MPGAGGVHVSYAISYSPLAAVYESCRDSCRIYAARLDRADNGTLRNGQAVNEEEKLLSSVALRQIAGWMQI
jgi:hypothetical protein